MKNGMYEDEFGTKRWYLNGLLHREDGPAIDWVDGDKEWYRNGKLHRENAPAYEGADGYKEWRLNGRLHREGGPAVEWADGTKEWYLNGEPHREDGPAVEYANGTKKWYLHDRLHREDGPAVEWADGRKERWVDGKHVTKEDVMGAPTCRCLTMPTEAAEDYLDMLELCRLVHAEVLGKEKPNMRVVQTLMVGWAERFLEEDDG